MKIVLTSDEIKRYNDEIIAYNVMHEFEEELHQESIVPATEYEVEVNVAYLINEAEKYEPYISADLNDQLVPGCHFAGFKDRIKLPKRLREKIISDANKEYNGDYQAAANNIHDVLRYTVILPFENHFQYLDNFLNDLIDINYKVRRVRNKWTDDYCKGVTAVLETPDGFPFEIQFHTQENYDMKEIYSREPYNLSRNPKADSKLKNKANMLRIYYHSLVRLPEGALTYEFTGNIKEK